MNAFEINPYIRLAIPSVVPPRWSIKRRIIFDYELVYIERGVLHLEYNNESYTCRAGQLILLRPGVPHSMKIGNKELSQPHIHFDMQYLPDSEQVPISFKDIQDCTPEELSFIREDIFENYKESPLIKIADMERFLDLFFGVIATSSPTEALKRKSLMLRIISILIEECFPHALTRLGEYPIERRIKDYIDAGQGTDISLTTLSRAFSYDKFYLEKKFKEAYGISIIAYRNKRRMALARSLLRTESVSCVAERLGYKSIYAFSRAYKTYFGTPPSAEREAKKTDN